MDDILFVTVDSLRADHLGCYGYDRDTSPTIDRLAAAGSRFSDAYAHSCSTRPSFPAIMTSSYPLMYGGYERLSERRTLVSEVLADAGYRTAGFHSNLYLNADFGYDRGFEQFFDSKTDPTATARLRQAVKSRLDHDGLVYRTLARLFEGAERHAGANVGSAYVPADEITDRAVEWVRETREDDAPRFCWVHYMDVHHPYVPPADHQRPFRDEPVGERRAVQLRRKMMQEPDSLTDEEFSTIVDLYDGEIRFTDHEIGRLVEAAEAAWGDPTVVVTADHGEELRDHGGFSHFATFYDEVLHVPLVLRDGDHRGTHEELVGLVDLAPTIADAAGGPVPEAFYGHSLYELLRGDGWPREAVLGDWANTDTGEARYAYRDHQHKYIRRADGDELYDLQADPGETENLLDGDGEPAVADRLRREIDAHVRRIEETAEDLGEVEMEEAVRERLRDLGYRE